MKSRVSHIRMLNELLVIVFQDAEKVLRILKYQRDRMVSILG